MGESSCGACAPLRLLQFLPHPRLDQADARDGFGLGFAALDDGGAAGGLGGSEDWADVFEHRTLTRKNWSA